MAGMRRFDEDEVLARAEEVFRLKGYEATSMLDLAQAAGVQRGSLYHAFGDKQALFLLVFARFEERFLAGVADMLDHEDPRLGLIAFFDAAIDGMTAGDPSRGCLSTRLASEGALPGPQVREEVRAFLGTLEARVRAVLERPACAGRLALPPAEAARLIVTLTRGLAVMERVRGDAAALRATAHALVDLIFPAASPLTHRQSPN